MFTTIIIFIIILGVLVFVHELGHFVTARRNGVTCHEFGFGFPPRLGGVVKDAATGKWRVIWGNEYYTGDKTLYSINWIPLGGFVRIKGEDGSEQTPDSFAVKSAWARFKILVAGVVMNFILAWFLIGIVLSLGFPQSQSALLSDNATVSDPIVQVAAVAPGSPAEEIGLRGGDVVREICGVQGCTAITSVAALQSAVAASAGEPVTVAVDRGDEQLFLSATPRVNAPDGEGALGIQINDVAVVSYPVHEAFFWSIGATYTITKNTLVAFGGIIKNLVVGEKVTAELAGPVGIALLTQQVRDLGLAHLLYFAAVLSINLGIINILPIPALDGGRILFVLIEKLKGSPVSKKVEGITHSVGFALLLLLMVVVTIRDIIKNF